MNLNLASQMFLGFFFPQEKEGPFCENFQLFDLCNFKILYFGTTFAVFAASL